MPNPFSTRRIRPGAIPFLFPAGESAVGLAEKLAEQGGWGQIIGPHGSGKSTLLAALGPALEARGGRVCLVALHAGERRLPALDRSALEPGGQLIIDGYEQLSWWSRRRVKSFCRRHRVGLLVTAHADVGLPPLYQTQPSVAVAQAVVERLLGDQPAAITPAAVAAAFEATGGNLRETLFRLYDTYQQTAEPPAEEPACRATESGVAESAR